METIVAEIFADVIELNYYNFNMKFYAEYKHGLSLLQKRSQFVSYILFLGQHAYLKPGKYQEEK